MLVAFILPAAAVLDGPLHRAAAVLPRHSEDTSSEAEEWRTLLASAPLDLRFPVTAVAAPGTKPHRQKSDLPPFNACVARSVGPKDVKTNAEASKAMNAEWTRLRAAVRPDGQEGC